MKVIEMVRVKTVPIGGNGEYSCVCGMKFQSREEYEAHFESK
jgi:hypothetical protein